MSSPVSRPASRWQTWLKAGFLLLLSGWLLYGSGVRYRQFNNPVAVAEVLNVRTYEHGRSLNFVLTVRYLPAQARLPVQANASVSRAQADTIGSGQRVRVHYDPANPAADVLLANTPRVFKSTLLVALVTGAWGVYLLLQLVRRQPNVVPPTP